MPHVACVVMAESLPAGVRCVVFDVGETLVDESRLWAGYAALTGVPVFTLMGVLGALIERGIDHHELWATLGVSTPEGQQVPIQSCDLYPDAIPCVSAALEAGLTVGVAGNQPSETEAILRDAGIHADFIAPSADWGVCKPDPLFFERVIDESRVAAGAVLYVGDRLDNDILPARKAGMRSAFLRRGPWGHIHARRAQSSLADMRLDSLAGLADCLRQLR